MSKFKHVGNSRYGFTHTSVDGTFTGVVMKVGRAWIAHCKQTDSIRTKSTRLAAVVVSTLR